MANQEQQIIMAKGIYCAPGKGEQVVLLQLLHNSGTGATVAKLDRNGAIDLANLMLKQARGLPFVVKGKKGGVVK